jgi:hypothetical protein
MSGLRFEREQGYFLRPMYVAYGIIVPVMALFMLIAWLAGAGSVRNSLLIAVVVCMPLGPWLLRFSRMIATDRLSDLN